MLHVTRMSLTTSIGLMAIFAVDFVDMIFISMLGNDALAAAVGYAGTLLFFTNAINIGLSISAGALVARELGAGRAEQARHYASSVAVIGLIAGLTTSGLVLLNLSFLLSLLGAEGEVLRLATRYVSIILPTMFVMSIAMTAMAVLRAHGDARRSMMATIYGGVVNAVLDPILIFAVGLGLDGAAIASVLARLCMLGAALWPALSGASGICAPFTEAGCKGFAPRAGDCNSGGSDKRRHADRQCNRCAGNRAIRNGCGCGHGGNRAAFAGGVFGHLRPVRRDRANHRAEFRGRKVRSCARGLSGRDQVHGYLRTFACRPFCSCCAHRLQICLQPRAKPEV